VTEVVAYEPGGVAVPAAPPVSPGAMTLRTELELWKEAFEFAKSIATTPFVPRPLQNNPAAVMACVLKGAELGVSALHALAQVHIIEGRPALSAELQRSLVLAAGHEIWLEESTVTRATMCGRRRGQDHVQRVTWTIEDARRASLGGKTNWRNYPRQMLVARCTGELVRFLFADVIAGMGYNVEEVADGVDDFAATLTAGEIGPGQSDPPPATTRRRARKSTAAPATAADGGSPGSAPGGPPPPLPDEEPSVAPPELPGPDVQPSRPSAGERRSGPDPEPSEVVTKRAQAIAMRANDAGVDHHDVVRAVTNGAKSSAKAVTAAEGSAVLEALNEIRRGRAELVKVGPDDGDWEVRPVLREAQPGDPPAATDANTERLQARVRDLAAKRRGDPGPEQQTIDTGEDPPT
jgi:hypothetical protein